MIGTLAEFNVYLNNFETSNSIDALKTAILETASSIVIEYLRWTPIEAEHVEYLKGNGTSNLYLKEQFIPLVTGVTVNDESVTGWNQYNNRLHKSSKWNKDLIYTVTYTSGWTAANIPSEITTTVYRIASLLWQETSGGIGKSSRTSADGSVQYYNYTNYMKFLSSVDRWRSPLELMEY